MGPDGLKNRDPIAAAGRETVDGHAAMVAFVCDFLIGHELVRALIRRSVVVHPDRPSKAVEAEGLPTGEDAVDRGIAQMGKAEIAFGCSRSDAGQPWRWSLAFHAVCGGGEHDDAFQREVLAEDGGVTAPLRVAGGRQAVPARFGAVAKGPPTMRCLLLSQPEEELS